MTALLLVLLAAAWVAIFLPAAWRARRDAPLSTAERFKRRMQLLAPRATSSGRWVVVPESTERLARASFARAQRRRRRLLAILVAGVVVTLVGALVAGGSFWEVHLAVDLCLALYVALLIEARKRREEREWKVARLQSMDERPVEEALRALGD